MLCLNIFSVLPLYRHYQAKITSRKNIPPLGGGWRAEAVFKSYIGLHVPTT